VNLANVNNNIPSVKVQSLPSNVKEQNGNCLVFIQYSNLEVGLSL